LIALHTPILDSPCSSPIAKTENRITSVKAI